MKRRGFLKGVLAAIAAAPVAAVAGKEAMKRGHRPRWDGEDLPIAFDTPEPSADVSYWFPSVSAKMAKDKPYQPGGLYAPGDGILGVVTEVDGDHVWVSIGGKP